MIEVRKFEKSDIDRVVEIYAQGIEKGKSTFNTEVPTAESWDKNHLEICRLGAFDGDRLQRVLQGRMRGFPLYR